MKKIDDQIHYAFGSVLKYICALLATKMCVCVCTTDILGCAFNKTF